MQTGTVLLIILSAIAALAIVLFQYYYGSKKRSRLQVALSFLRFLALFSIFLLLINPKFIRNEYILEKANLVLLLDNSSSINTEETQSEVEEILGSLGTNKKITDKFHLSAHSFGKFLNNSDSLTHSERATNISKALATANEIYGKTAMAVILVTDGNQTLGEDYEFYGRNQQFPVYPIAVGDTTQYADIGIDQLNTNKYAFLNNKFPVEIYVSYQGQDPVSGRLTISMDGNTVYREELKLTNTDNSKVISTLITANSVGVKKMSVKVTALENERNLANNYRTTAVEVIDEKTNIVIISEVLHPDIGALKKAIESNEQRSVVIKNPGAPLTDLEDVDLFILYQPRPSFREVFNYIKEKGSSRFTITGGKTDWDFLNGIQNSFTKSSYSQSEEMSPVMNSGFTIFDISGFSVEDFPPLQGYLGEILVTKSSETILDQKIKGVELNEPLLCVIQGDAEKEAVLFGENIWKWRAQSYRNEQNFKGFDDLIGKIIRYLSTNEPKSRLLLDYQSTYQGINDAIISATYFDETFVFDSNASIIVSLKNEEGTLSRDIPMLLMNGYYTADLSNLPPGRYSFTVAVQNEDISRSGSFTMLDFDVEKQFFSSNYRKLEQLADATNGSLYYPTEKEQLMEDLLIDARFVPTQKSNQNVVSLVDFRLLLVIIVAALTAEWFLRKYNGLI